MSTRRIAAGVFIALVAGCGEDSADDVGGAREPAVAVDFASAPTPVTRVGDVGSACDECHPGVVDRYRSSHGMANSLGAVGSVTPGVVDNPHNGWRYEIDARETDARLLATAPDGGVRTQRVVGRIGAGNKDVSLVTTEVVAGQATGHLFFAPVEWLPGHGWELSPFEGFGGNVAVDFGLETGCLQCHTGTGPASLPAAARPMDALGDEWARLSPRNLLGVDAFEHLAALSCDTCHGDTSAHVTAMRTEPGGPLAITPWDERSLAARRDACARCHMDGEARVDLAELNGALPPAGRTSFSLRPVVVTAEPDDDFRFVAHHERMALSRCFSESAEMTCLSCHSPHTGTAGQGVPSFDARCMTCHTDDNDEHTCSRAPTLTVRDVTQREARSDDGCIDCHMRRTQPFDLGHLAVSDHFVRRSPPPPKTNPLRAFHDADGKLRVFRPDGWDELLNSPAGRKWERGVIGMAYVKQGRFEEAAVALAEFRAPEHPDALRPTAPAGLQPLETSPAFHQIRGLVAEARGRSADAERHYRNVLALEPGHPGARLNLAALLLARGDHAGTHEHLTALLDRFPATPKAWNLMARFGAQVGDVRGAASALAQSAALWPSDAVIHRELARLFEALGDTDAARASLERARRLSPSISSQR